MSQCDSTPLIAAQANISLLQMSKLLNSLINDHLIKLKSSHVSIQIHQKTKKLLKEHSIGFALT